MTIYDNVFPLGLGTNRFPLGAAATDEEIDHSAEIVLRALDMGVNYIDTAMSYSGGHASEVLRRALRQTKAPYRITSKLTSRLKTADAARRAVEQHLSAMGIDRVSDLMVWSIFNFDEFEDVMRPGGIYEGALRLKEEGLAEHITFSVHASTSDILKILKEGAFSGVMISMSVMNAVIMKSILDYAYEHEIGVAVMNPLGGGFIPQKKEQFSFLRNKQEDSIVQSALRFVKSHPVVKVVVAGPASVQELEEDVNAFAKDDVEIGEKRWKRVSSSLSELGDFCTGCRYCEPCPKGIPIPLLMQSRNALLFDPPEGYRCTDLETLKNIQVFKRMNFELSYLPETNQNPCVRCGECERKCTQHLRIMDCVSDMYTRMRRTRYSKNARKDRLNQLLNGKGYQKVAIWPGGVPYGTHVVEAYREFFGEPTFEFCYFNSSSGLHGKIVDGRKVYAPDELTAVRPDCVLVVSYTYRKEIVNSLEPYRAQGFDILELHTDGDVPWLY